MKRVFLFAGLLWFSSFGMAQRLPKLAVPESYRLTFTPDLTKNIFTGEETIQLRVLKSTPEMMLHAADIDFQQVTITSAVGTQTAKVTLDKDSQIAHLAVDRPLQPGAATIQIRYTGILNDQLRGFYIGKDDQGRKYAATQLEA